MSSKSRSKRRTRPSRKVLEAEAGDAAQPEAELVEVHDQEEEPSEEQPDVLMEDKEGAEEGREQREKEAEVWEAFKEEFFETVEQLPLSLERHFTLLKELDEHVHEYQTSFLPMLQRYTEWRRLRAGLNQAKAQEPNDQEAQHDPEQMNVDPPSAAVDSNHTEPEGMLHTPPRISNPPELLNKKSASAPPAERAASKTATPTSVPPVPENSIQAQVMLSRVARLSEEIVSASQEKVNVAKSAYDTVDRHIRLLDQAIKEQELALSHGLRPGTLPAPIVLPDVMVPKRQTRTHQTPPPSDLENMAVDVMEAPEAEGAPTMGISSEVVEGRVAPKSRRKGKGRGRGRPKKGAGEQEEGQDEGAPLAPATTNIKSVKLTVPPVVPQIPDIAANPDEPRYCFCNQVSYGEMIACDNPNCEREWFHYGCVDLTEAPRGKWYCRDCKDVATRPKARRKRR
ncbi:hypothetical protein GLOTRDRAFT_138331 [Gloeophyllum trabeum ATCC 11539]|uniref:Chromatin modification-related protein n=1 Tax=Gloeophyllum trabeum (strain ATCC 11539 / FP-39264 / Madison 617) TaxID=670483 RepID=S7RU18_GLOTA|nr:uncharacterized protein GLOTRDRAFT_138331 [Gloeophyllum trabeum ATCC 11539]EPQ56664.1 hypothetical protein GLOTRDRAFT_138331 [Gloeophyllum trabeum ATCC 11539]